MAGQAIGADRPPRRIASSCGVGSDLLTHTRKDRPRPYLSHDDTSDPKDPQIVLLGAELNAGAEAQASRES